MLIDCLKHETWPGGNRIAWLLVVVLLKLFGAGLYYFMRRRPRRLAARA